MEAKRNTVFGGLAVLMVIGIVVSLLLTFGANPDQDQSGLLIADEAKAKGLAEAKLAGLVGDPTSEFTMLTTLEDYIATSSHESGQLGSDASAVGLHGDKEVWVVAFQGTVNMTLPGSGGKTYDNITLALDAETGEIIGVNAYVEGQTLPYR